MDVINLLISKLSQYGFLTNIIPGTILCLILKYIVGYDVIPSAYYQAGLVFYFVGMINGRIGSLIIEPFLKKIKWIVFAPYEDFIAAEKQDDKIVILSQENNTYRAYVSVMFISLLGLLYRDAVTVCQFIKTNDDWIILLVAFIIFLFAYRKQTRYVKERVEKNLSK